jgi:hypothetical protein
LDGQGEKIQKARIDSQQTVKKRSNPYANPYAKQTSNQQQQNGGMNNPNVVSRPEKVVRRGLSLSSLVANKQRQESDKVDQVKKLLNQSESETYAGKAPVGATSLMKSSAPQNLTCTICYQSSEKVSIEKKLLCARATDPSPNANLLHSSAVPGRLRPYGMLGLLAAMARRIRNMPRL